MSTAHEFEPGSTVYRRNPGAGLDIHPGAGIGAVPYAGDELSPLAYLAVQQQLAPSYFGGNDQEKDIAHTKLAELADASPTIAMAAWAIKTAGETEESPDQNFWVDPEVPTPPVKSPVRHGPFAYGKGLRRVEERMVQVRRQQWQAMEDALATGSGTVTLQEALRYPLHTHVSRRTKRVRWTSLTKPA